MAAGVTDILAASNGELNQRDKDGGQRQRTNRGRMKPVTIR
jgi:hypothetical protein